jgi:tRNA A-37 threonylcarbamoyl transferase component Bud32
MTGYGALLKKRRLAEKANALARDISMLILNNIVFEAIIIVALGLCYLFTTTFDRLFNTRLRRSFTSWMQRISADNLNVLRREQIRYIFKRKYGLKKIKIKLAGGSYWISIPCVVKGVDKKTHAEKKYMAKIINDRSTLKHKYLTMMRNFGLMAERRPLKFEEHRNPREMGEFERQCLVGMRRSSANAPEVYGLHHLGADDYMLVMDFIEGRPLSDMDIDSKMLDDVFQALKSIHEGGVYHGDIKLDNFIFSNGKVFVFDCLKLDTKGEQAAAFDLACLLCALAEKVPVNVILEHARRHFSAGELKLAADMIDLALYKSDLELSADKVGELMQGLRVTP